MVDDLKLNLSLAFGKHLVSFLLWISPIFFTLGKPSIIKQAHYTHTVKAPPLSFPSQIPSEAHGRKVTHTGFLCLCFIAHWYCIINQQCILTLEVCPAVSAPGRTSPLLPNDHKTPPWDISQPVSQLPSPPSTCTQTHTHRLCCLSSTENLWLW